MSLLVRLLVATAWLLATIAAAVATIVWSRSGDLAEFSNTVHRQTYNDYWLPIMVTAVISWTLASLLAKKPLLAAAGIIAIVVGATGPLWVEYYLNPQRSGLPMADQLRLHLDAWLHLTMVVSVVLLLVIGALVWSLAGASKTSGDKDPQSVVCSSCAQRQKAIEQDLERLKHQSAKPTS